MWDDGKGVCVGRAFSVTFCVLSFFCILAHAYRSYQKTDHDRLWLKGVFPRKVVAFGNFDYKK